MPPYFSHLCILLSNQLFLIMISFVRRFNKFMYDIFHTSGFDLVKVIVRDVLNKTKNIHVIIVMHARVNRDELSRC